MCAEACNASVAAAAAKLLLSCGGGGGGGGGAGAAGAEAVHPSWAAKAAQRKIQPFQGKKIVFGD